MKKYLVIIVIVFIFLCYGMPSFATNGDNLIGIGPISRAMGGTGIAGPVDAISAVFANPSAMCFGGYSPSSEFNFAGTLFMPKVRAKITNMAGVIKSDSHENVYAIPAIGITTPIGEESSGLRFGLAAYGVTGLGVDYRGSDIDNPSFYDFGPMGQFPLASGEYTSLQIMKFAAALAYQYSEKMSLGMTIHIDYGALDLRSGTAIGYAFGIQPGMTYRLTDELSFGLTYVTSQKVDHKNVADFDQDGSLDTLALESPQQIGLGVAYNIRSLKTLLEMDAKWINWSDADGYKDFDWEDQLVLALGAQVNASDNLFFRIGYNYGKNPLKKHNGFDGTVNPFDMTQNATNVQGKLINNYYYETFRIIGFPAIVEQHISLGIGYSFTDNFSLHLGIMNAIEQNIKESGLDITGNAVTLESILSEKSIDFGLTWRF